MSCLNDILLLGLLPNTGFYNILIYGIFGMKLNKMPLNFTK